MSWNTSVILIRQDLSGDWPGLLETLGFRDPAPAGTVSWEEASSNSLDGKAVGVKDGWTVVWDPDGFTTVWDPEPTDDYLFWPAIVDRALKKLSRGSPALGLVWAGVGDAHGFAWYLDGRRPRWRFAHGSQVDQGGQPLPEEEVFRQTMDEEDRLFLLMGRLTLPMSALEDVTFEVYRVAR
jgi:hypothetical protein